MPRRCERRTLPIELIPRVVTEAGFEPAPPKRLVPKTSALDHSAIQPSHTIKRCSCRGSNPGPSAHKTEALPTAPQEHIYALKVRTASGGGRTHDLGIMRPTRCQLRHRGFSARPGTAVPRVKTLRHPGIEPGPSRWQRDIITTRLMTHWLICKRG